jgi:hypothetical protein
MTEEDITLLLKDLSARLPYGVKIALKNNGSYHHDNVAKKGDITIDKLKGFTGSYFNIYHSNPLDWDWYDDDIDIEDIKPYLFPLSSMTEEQWKEYQTLKMTDWVEGDINGVFINAGTITDWLNKNHFDYRGLIEKGLAIDATNLNIY